MNPLICESQNLVAHLTNIVLYKHSISSVGFNLGCKCIGPRGVYLGQRLDFRFSVLSRFKIGFCVHVILYIIVNHFEVGANRVQFLGRVNFGSLGLF